LTLGTNTFDDYVRTGFTFIKGQYIAMAIHLVSI